MTWTPSEEGVTHINAYSQSKTVLGSLLSNFAKSPFTCKDGSFMSIEGYWYWLSCSHQRRDELRHVYGFRAKKLGKELKGKDWVHDPEFQSKIERAMYIKLITNKQLYTLLRNSTLPIVHYYAYGGKVVEPTSGKWIWEFYERARKYLKEQKETNNV